MLLEGKVEWEDFREGTSSLRANVYSCVSSAVGWGRGQGSGLAGMVGPQDGAARKAPREASLEQGPFPAIRATLCYATARALCPRAPGLSRSVVLCDAAGQPGLHRPDAPVRLFVWL